MSDTAEVLHLPPAMTADELRAANARPDGPFWDPVRGSWYIIDPADD